MNQHLTRKWLTSAKAIVGLGLAIVSIGVALFISLDYDQDRSPSAFNEQVSEYNKLLLIKTYVDEYVLQERNDVSGFGSPGSYIILHSLDENIEILDRFVKGTDVGIAEVNTILGLVNKRSDNPGKEYAGTLHDLVNSAHAVVGNHASYLKNILGSSRQVEDLSLLQIRGLLLHIHPEIFENVRSIFFGRGKEQFAVASLESGAGLESFNNLKTKNFPVTGPAHIRSVETRKFIERLRVTPDEILSMTMSELDDFMENQKSKLNNRAEKLLGRDRISITDHLPSLPMSLALELYPLLLFVFFGLWSSVAIYLRNLLRRQDCLDEHPGFGLPVILTLPPSNNIGMMAFREIVCSLPIIILIVILISPSHAFFIDAQSREVLERFSRIEAGESIHDLGIIIPAAIAAVVGWLVSILCRYLLGREAELMEK